MLNTIKFEGCVEFESLNGHGTRKCDVIVEGMEGAHFDDPLVVIFDAGDSAPMPDWYESLAAELAKRFGAEGVDGLCMWERGAFDGEFEYSPVNPVTGEVGVPVSKCELPYRAEQLAEAFTPFTQRMDFPRRRRWW